MHGRAAGWLSLVGRRCWLSCVGFQLLVVDCWLWINLFLIVACRLLVGGCWLSLVGFRSLVGDLLFVDSWLSIVAWRLLVVDCFGVDRWLSIVGCRWPAADYCLPIGRLSRWLAVRPLLSLLGADVGHRVLVVAGWSSFAVLIANTWSRCRRASGTAHATNIWVSGCASSAKHTMSVAP